MSCQTDAFSKVFRPKAASPCRHTTYKQCLLAGDRNRVAPDTENVSKTEHKCGAKRLFSSVSAVMASTYRMVPELNAMFNKSNALGCSVSLTLHHHCAPLSASVKEQSNWGLYLQKMCQDDDVRMKSSGKDPKGFLLNDLRKGKSSRDSSPQTRDVARNEHPRA